MQTYISTQGKLNNGELRDKTSNLRPKSLNNWAGPENVVKICMSSTYLQHWEETPGYVLCNLYGVKYILCTILNWISLSRQATSWEKGQSHTSSQSSLSMSGATDCHAEQRGSMPTCTGGWRALYKIDNGFDKVSSLYIQGLGSPPQALSPFYPFHYTVPHPPPIPLFTPYPGLLFTITSKLKICKGF